MRPCEASWSRADRVMLYFTLTTWKLSTSSEASYRLETLKREAASCSAGKTVQNVFTTSPPSLFTCWGGGGVLVSTVSVIVSLDVPGTSAIPGAALLTLPFTLASLKVLKKTRVDCQCLQCKVTITTRTDPGSLNCKLWRLEIPMTMRRWALR